MAGLVMVAVAQAEAADAIMRRRHSPAGRLSQSRVASHRAAIPNDIRYRTCMLARNRPCMAMGTSKQELHQGRVTRKGSTGGKSGGMGGRTHVDDAGCLRPSRCASKACWLGTDAPSIR